jgi:hypothetical protein
LQATVLFEAQINPKFPFAGEVTVNFTPHCEERPEESMMVTMIP